MTTAPQPPGRRIRLTRWTINPLLHDHIWTDDQSVVASYDDGQRGVLIELDLSAGVNPDDVFAQFLEGHRERLPEAQAPERLSARYVRAVLDRQQLRRLVNADQPVPPRSTALPSVVDEAPGKSSELLGEIPHLPCQLTTEHQDHQQHTLDDRSWSLSA